MSFCSKETPSILTPHLSVPQRPHWALGELLLAQLLEQPRAQVQPLLSLRQGTLIGGGKCHSDIAAAVALILVFVHHELLTSYRVKEFRIMSTEGFFLHPLNFQPIPVPLTLVWVSPLPSIQKTRLSTGLPRRSDHWITSSHTWQTLGPSGYNICRAIDLKAPSADQTD